MASMISSSDQRLSTSKRRLKPLMLRDYLLDHDLSSSSSNGFKSFPRRQTTTSSSSSTVRRFLDAEIKRSGLIRHHKPRRLTKRSRTTCGTAISDAVHRASKVFLNAVTLLTLPPSSTVRKPGVFSKRLISKSFWRKRVSQTRRQITGDGDGEIQWWRSAAYFSDEETSDLISHISIVDEAISSSSISLAAITTVELISGGGESSSSGTSEIYTNSSSSTEEVVESPSLSSSFSNENDAVEEGGENDGSYINRNRKECENGEKEQLSPVSILECPFEDDDEDDTVDDLFPNQNDSNELLLASKAVDKLLCDYLQDYDINGAKEEMTVVVKKVEDWVMGKDEEEMFMSWEVREERQVYVKEMKWGCVNGDERESVVEDLVNGFFTSLVDEFIFDLASS